MDKYCTVNSVFKYTFDSHSFALGYERGSTDLRHESLILFNIIYKIDIVMLFMNIFFLAFRTQFKPQHFSSANNQCSSSFFSVLNFGGTHTCHLKVAKQQLLVGSYIGGGGRQ
jgi:hypothetical protein